MASMMLTTADPPDDPPQRSIRLHVTLDKDHPENNIFNYAELMRKATGQDTNGKPGKSTTSPAKPLGRDGAEVEDDDDGSADDEESGAASGAAPTKLRKSLEDDYDLDDAFIDDSDLFWSEVGSVPPVDLDCGFFAYKGPVEDFFLSEYNKKMFDRQKDPSPSKRGKGKKKVVGGETKGKVAGSESKGKAATTSGEGSEPVRKRAKKVSAAATATASPAAGASGPTPMTSPNAGGNSKERRSSTAGTSSGVVAGIEVSTTDSSSSDDVSPRAQTSKPGPRPVTIVKVKKGKPATPNPPVPMGLDDEKTLSQLAPPTTKEKPKKKTTQQQQQQPDGGTPKKYKSTTSASSTKPSPSKKRDRKDEPQSSGADIPRPVGADTPLPQPASASASTPAVGAEPVKKKQRKESVAGPRKSKAHETTTTSAAAAVNHRPITTTDVTPAATPKTQPAVKQPMSAPPAQDTVEAATKPKAVAKPHRLSDADSLTNGSSSHSKPFGGQSSQSLPRKVAQRLRAAAEAADKIKPTSDNPLPTELRTLVSKAADQAINAGWLNERFFEEVERFVPLDSDALRRTLKAYAIPRRLERLKPRIKQLYKDFEDMIHEAIQRPPQPAVDSTGGDESAENGGAKFRWTDKSRFAFWDILCGEWEMAQLDNEYNIAVNNPPAFTEMGVRKAIYAKVQSFWPEGTMSLDALSRVYSWMKRKIAEKNTAGEETIYDPFKSKAKKRKSAPPALESGFDFKAEFAQLDDERAGSASAAVVGPPPAKKVKETKALQPPVHSPGSSEGTKLVVVETSKTAPVMMTVATQPAQSTPHPPPPALEKVRTPPVVVKRKSSDATGSVGHSQRKSSDATGSVGHIEHTPSPNQAPKKS
ncbi:uncharacterized protein EV422DRAFT_266781 [Fimicolochytrium jonesii]|uniref:uncharacterized protein n=1 Tax=Fimicolochytrium jonesii TaxID=1396493 RepID=UPI0022FE973D|nr:uncharacterized protein EV422DRAFT_266781 [Fimicolochytrium jonesii]KAI8816945.1 hypothetical protein EV422DRAFT_266781 [Fimicolochytrium jonesii]